MRVRQRQAAARQFVAERHRALIKCGEEDAAFRPGEVVYRKGQPCTVVAVGYDTCPPHIVVRTSDGHEVGTEPSYLERLAPASPRRPLALTGKRSARADVRDIRPTALAAPGMEDVVVTSSPASTSERHAALARMRNRRAERAAEAARERDDTLADLLDDRHESNSEAQMPRAPPAQAKKSDSRHERAADLETPRPRPALPKQLPAARHRCEQVANAEMPAELLPMANSPEVEAVSTQSDGTPVPALDTASDACMSEARGEAGACDGTTVALAGDANVGLAVDTASPNAREIDITSRTCEERAPPDGAAEISSELAAEVAAEATFEAMQDLSSSGLAVLPPESAAFSDEEIEDENDERTEEAERLRRQEEERSRVAELEAERKSIAEQERRMAEQRRKEEEEEKQRLAEEARIQAELEAEKKRREAEEKERSRREAELERRRLEAEQLEQERKRKEWEEAERRRKEEEERLRIEAEEAERKRQEAEERLRKEAEEAERKQREEEEAEQRRREAEETERRKQEAEEAGRKRMEAERRQREAEEAERKRRAAEEADRKRREAEEAERRQREAEEAERKRRKAEEAEARRREAEETARRQREAAENERRRREAEEAKRRQQEAEAERARREAEDLERKRREAERARREAEEIERKRREAEAEMQRRRDEADRLRQEEEDLARLQAENAGMRRAAEKKLERATGLPPREKVAEPQKAMMAAMMAQPPAKPAKPNGPCDKCDGKHDTDACPHFKKARDKHADAWQNYGSKGSESASAQWPVLRRARVVPQPGDGSCLFHSLSYGLRGTNASRLRAEIAEYIAKNPNTTVANNPIKDWVLWDTGMDTSSYASRMRTGSQWGGAVELAVCAKMRSVHVHVYERGNSGFKRISSFEGDAGPGAPVVSLCYGGRVHYDALEV